MVALKYLSTDVAHLVRLLSASSNTHSTTTFNQTLRSVTKESVAFTKTFSAPQATAQEKEQSLRLAVKAHGERAKEAKVREYHAAAIFLAVLTGLYL